VDGIFLLAALQWAPCDDLVSDARATLKAIFKKVTLGWADATPVGPEVATAIPSLVMVHLLLMLAPGAPRVLPGQGSALLLMSATRGRFSDAIANRADPDVCTHRAGS
jgi:hypothetical protein